MDIVFVHGLSSSADQAWKNTQGDLWPLWLRQIFPNCRVLLLNYPAPMFFYSSTSRLSVKERARSMADLLPTIGIGTRPTIFVCHSLGGILVKEILRSCVETGCSPYVVTNTAGIVFLATPHSGSDIASLTKSLGSSLTKELEKDSDYLLDLKQWFINHVMTTSIRVSSYYETQKFKGVIVVEKDSANPECSECIPIPIDADHSSICKPESLNSDIFIRIKRDIESSINGVNLMTKNLTNIMDIIALPEITNQMYFDILHFLNRLFCENGYGQRAVIISNPCGGPKPCCLIVTKDQTLLEQVEPIVNRWPERFSVHSGILGEFTSPPDKDNLPTFNLDKSKLSIDGTDITKVYTRFLSEVFDLIIDIKVCMFWDEENVTKAIIPAHRFEMKVRNWCDKYLSSLINDTKNRKIENSDKEDYYLAFSKLLAKKNYMTESVRTECIHAGINDIYERNLFRVYFDDFKSKNNKRNSFSCRIDHVNYKNDVIVLSFDKVQTKRKLFIEWKNQNNILDMTKERFNYSSLKAGDDCYSPQYSSKHLVVERINENVFFPLVDKITSLSSVLVISGGNAQSGDSGSPILDKEGNVRAMVIGKTTELGQSKILAVSISSEDMTKKVINVIKS